MGNAAPSAAAVVACSTDTLSWQDEDDKTRINVELIKHLSKKTLKDKDKEKDGDAAEGEGAAADGGSGSSSETVALLEDEISLIKETWEFIRSNITEVLTAAFINLFLEHLEIKDKFEAFRGYTIEDLRTIKSGQGIGEKGAGTAVWF